MDTIHKSLYIFLPLKILMKNVQMRVPVYSDKSGFNHNNPNVDKKSIQSAFVSYTSITFLKDHFRTRW